MFDDTLESIQSEIKVWSNGNFGNNHSRDVNGISEGSPLGSLPALLGAVEELGELCHTVVYRHQARGFSNSHEYRKSMEDALGDILVYLCDFSGREHISLIQCLRTEWKKVRNRNQATWLADKAKEKKLTKPTVSENCQENTGPDWGGN